jgi:hypothetical protein
MKKEITNTQLLEKIEAGFNKARLERVAGFEQAKLERVAGFEQAKLERDAGFEEARSERVAGFEEARLERVTGFEEAQLARDAGFEEASKARGVGFENARSEREAGFENAKQERITGFKNANNERESLLAVTKLGFDHQSKQIDKNTKAIESLKGHVIQNGDCIAKMIKKMDQEFAAATIDRKRLHRRIDEHELAHH